MTEEFENYDDLDGMCGLTAEQWREIVATDDPEEDCVAFATEELYLEFEDDNEKTTV